MAKKYSYDGATVDWFGEEVLLAVQDATAEGIHAVALEVESQAKQNIVALDLVDTGFMLGSVYSNGPEGSSYPGEGSGDKPPGAGLFPEGQPGGPYEAIVAAAAEYALWTEIRWGAWLFPALQQVAQSSAMIKIKKVFKSKGF